MEFKRYFLILVSVVTTVFTGCVKQRPPVDTASPAPQRYLTHRVKGYNESLGTLAKWYTGNKENWKQIAKENPFLGGYKLRDGDLVAIPRSMVVNDKPYPTKNFPTSTKKKSTSVLKKVTPVATIAATGIPTVLPTALPTVDSILQPTVQPSAVPVVPTVEATIVVAVPDSPTTAPTVANVEATPLASEEKALDDLIAEEQRALELLKGELQGTNRN